MLNQILVKHVISLKTSDAGRRRTSKRKGLKTVKRRDEFLTDASNTLFSSTAACYPAKNFFASGTKMTAAAFRSNTNRAAWR